MGNPNEGLVTLGPHGNKFTPEITERFLEGIRYQGMTLKAACGYVGIAMRTLERWHARARAEAEDQGGDEPGPYMTFFLDIELAQTAALGTVEQQQWRLMMAGDGPSIRRWMEALHPATWGRQGSSRAPVVITGDNAKVAILQEGTSQNPEDYFGVESIITNPAAIEAPEEA